MLVRHTMTQDPFTVAPADLCLDVLRHMRARGYRHAPVVEEGRLVGVVSERDLLKALPHLVEAFDGDAGDQALAAPVRSVMTPHPVGCAPSDPVDVVARRMLEQRLGCMTVVHEGRLVGIVTTTDLLRGFTDHLIAEDARAMTFVWTKGGLATAPDVAALAAAAGAQIVAYFATETSTRALALLVRVRGDEGQRSRFVRQCVDAGLLLMSSRAAA